MFPAALFIMAKKWKQSKCPLTKCDMFNIMEYYSVKKKWDIYTCYNIDEP